MDVEEYSPVEKKTVQNYSIKAKKDKNGNSNVF